MNGGFRTDLVEATAKFNVCGQGIRERGDVKLRGVLVGRIGAIERETGRCTITLELQPGQLDQIPANVGAQIRAKTIFGEKWVELLYPKQPSGELVAGDVIPPSRTIDPLEIETILNLSAPLLDAIDPEHLAGALDALASGFAGHEDSAIRGIESGLAAMRPINDNPALAQRGIRDLKESAEIFQNVDDDLLASLENLDRLNRFTVENQELLAENLRKAPTLLRELSTLFETRFGDLTRIVDRGATVISVMAARSDDLDRLLEVLPRFNSAWIRNLSHVCEHRTISDENEDIRGAGTRVPGRCWRVHNLPAESRGTYAPGEGPGRRESRAIAVESSAPITRLLRAPMDGLGGSRR